MKTTPKQEEICRILGLSGDTDLSVILWRPTDQRPREGSRVLILCGEEDKRMCIGAAYADDRFCMLCPNGSKRIPEDEILAWSYFPYDGE